MEEKRRQRKVTRTLDGAKNFVVVVAGGFAWVCRTRIKIQVAIIQAQKIWTEINTVCLLYVPWTRNGVAGNWIICRTMGNGNDHSSRL